MPIYGNIARNLLRFHEKGQSMLDANDESDNGQKHVRLQLLSSVHALFQNGHSY